MVTKQVAYAMWRFTMWTKGYGSYNDIERLIEEGDLVPFREYPDRSSAAAPDQANEPLPFTDAGRHPDDPEFDAVCDALWEKYK